jgi:hypothetical protein
MTKARDLANASTALSAVSATELAFVDGVTSAIQTQIDAKLATATAATTYVANSLADAKGDLLTATADNTPARLAVGSNGETLVADSAATTGLRYSATPSASNPLINSAMQVWQRGTSVAVAASVPAYVADRWYLGNGVNQACTVSRQVTGDTTNLPSIQYCARVQRNSGQTGTGALIFSQPIETINSIPFVGKTVTYSFYARAGANYSPTSSALTAYLIGGTGTDQQVVSFTGASVIIGSTATLTSTWQRFSYSATVATSVTQLGARFDCSPTGTAGVNDYYEITGVQIDVGSVALPFRTYAATIQGELAACQRYYYLAASGTDNDPMFGGFLYATNYIMAVCPFPTTMRVPPSLSFTTGTSYYNAYIAGSSVLFSGANFAINESGTNAAWIFESSSGIGGGGGDGIIIKTNNASARFAFSAEL